MRRALIIISGLCLVTVAAAQEIPVTAERQLEQLASMEGADQDDDQLFQQLEMYAKHRLDINGEAVEVLVQSGIASIQQGRNLDNYRKLFGNLVHIYELQAVPGWDPVFIR